MGVVSFFSQAFRPNPELKSFTIKKENKVAGFLGGGRLTGALTTYNDYYLFSTSEIDGTRMTIGILTKVFVVQDLKLE